MRRRFPTIAAIGLIALVVGAGVTAAVATSGDSATNQQVQPQVSDQTADERTITVSASGSAQREPDQVTIRIAVEETGDSAQAVRQRLADRTADLRSALAGIGITDDQIQTARYDIGQEERGPPDQGEQPQYRYRGIHSYTITVSNVNSTGQIIDTAVSNGANRIEDIQFGLSETQRRTLQNDALRDAMENAGSQAETLASASDLTISGVHSVETAENAYQPRYETTALADGGGGTQVESGPVRVQVQVRVTYTAGPA